MALPFIAPEVEIELADIWYYIARESGSSEIANRIVDNITQRFFLIAQSPHIGRKRDSLRPGLRSFPINDYLIFYRIEDSAAIILHVVHGSRNLEALLGD